MGSPNAERGARLCVHTISLVRAGLLGAESGQAVPADSSIEPGAFLPEVRVVTDLDIFHKINSLSAEEEELYASAGDGSGLTAEATERLEAIKVELDRTYDLLHQRQARQAAGLDPDEALERPA